MTRLFAPAITRRLSLLTSFGWLVAAATVVSTAAASPKERTPAPVVHRFTASPAGLAVNGYVVEGTHGLVAVDSALTVSDARALRAKIDALGKPLLAILLTHGHPDHYNGVIYLVEGRRVPVYATTAVAKVIHEADAAKEKQWKPVFGAEWPPRRAFPDHVVPDGTRLTFDRMTFVARDLGPGESHADAIWELTGKERSAFIGDLVLNGEHAYTSDGHTASWLASLDRLERELAGVKNIYPGHGPAGDLSLLEWERRYLVAFRREVDTLRSGATKLTDVQKKTLADKMKAAYPNAGLDFLIGLGADPVAAELARDQTESTRGRRAQENARP
jgi:glyoxylase-like metal-dependent hydrolase (beta-lactamase superfamily II)